MKRYLDLIKATAALGRMPTNTLCPMLEGKEEYEWFRPNEEETERLLLDELKCNLAWESDDFTAKAFIMTDLRLTIILFCAAASGELTKNNPKKFLEKFGRRQ